MAFYLLHNYMDFIFLPASLYLITQPLLLYDFWKSGSLFGIILTVIFAIFLCISIYKMLRSEIPAFLVSFLEPFFEKNKKNKDEINIQKDKSNEKLSSPRQVKNKRPVDFNSIPLEYIAFDLETTGLESDAEIIQISAVHFNDGQELRSFNEFVKPSIPIPDTITNLTGITNSDVENADDIDSVSKRFIEFIKDFPLTGYNSANFDLPKFYKLTGFDLKDNGHFDTLHLVRSTQLSTLLPDNKLSTVKYHYGLGSRGHDALNDSRDTARIVEFIRNKDFKQRYQTTDSSNKFENLNFCITGHFDIGKNVIEEMITSRGGVIKRGMSRNIDYFVVGPQVAKNIADPVGMRSSKEIRYEEPIEQGHSIIKLNEEEFLNMID